MTTTPNHRIRWYVWSWDADGNRERTPRNARMRGLWGYDAECSCGWATRTGGATRRSVEDEIWFHKVANHAVDVDIIN